MFNLNFYEFSHHLCNLQFAKLSTLATSFQRVCVICSAAYLDFILSHTRTFISSRISFFSTILLHLVMVPPCPNLHIRVTFDTEVP